MIKSFGNKLAQDLFNGITSKDTLKFPPELKRSAYRKLFALHIAAKPDELRLPPGNRLEQLKGNRAAFYSIRINDQWRIIFRWEPKDAFEVQILDYH